MKKYLRKFLDWLFEDSEDAIFRIILCVGLGLLTLFFLLCLASMSILLLHMIF